MSSRIGTRYQEAGRAGIAAARAALDRSRPATGPRQLAVVGTDGQLRTVFEADADRALAATGTDIECPLPYRDND